MSKNPNSGSEEEMYFELEGSRSDARLHLSEIQRLEGEGGVSLDSKNSESLTDPNELPSHNGLQIEDF